MTAKTSPAPAAEKKAATPRRTTAAKKAAPAKATPAKKAAPKPEVDITRKTPYGTEYRVVRAATVKVQTDLPWLTICLAHDEHVSSKSLRDACLLGTKGATAGWCVGCDKIRNGKDNPAAKEAETPAKTSKAPAKGTTRRSRSAAAKATPAS